MFTITRKFFLQVCYPLPPELCEMIRKYFREDRLKFILATKQTKADNFWGKSAECYHKTLFLRKYHFRRRSLVKLMYERIFNESLSEKFIEVFTLTRKDPLCYESSIISVVVNIGNSKILGPVHRFTWLPYTPATAGIMHPWGGFGAIVNIPQNEQEILGYMATFKDEIVPHQCIYREWPPKMYEPSLTFYDTSDAEYENATSDTNTFSSQEEEYPVVPPNSPIGF